MDNPAIRILLLAIFATLGLILVSASTAFTFQIGFLMGISTANYTDKFTGLDEGEALVACEALCPSSSLNCSEWEDCRSLYPDLCKGFIIICRDPGGPAANVKITGPEKAALDNPALQQYLQIRNAKLLTVEVPRLIFYFFTTIMLLILLIFIIRSRPDRLQSIRVESRNARPTGQGQGDEKVMILESGTTDRDILKPGELAKIRKAVLKAIEAEGGVGGVKNV